MDVYRSKIAGYIARYFEVTQHHIIVQANTVTRYTYFAAKVAKVIYLFSFNGQRAFRWANKSGKEPNM